ncbi:NAD-dependent epimerase/dehydratase family protein [Streptomyces sp. NPDC053048]|uniref:NAD-dependent epimerase/dehydratase family protein n=1 Tax=Streptomyces sp. NPDC053048 TaxID=3365694 RepID=UPI0037D5F1E6
MLPTIMITGASGFIGSRVVRAAARVPGVPSLRLMAHRQALPEDLSGAALRIDADLAVPSSLRGTCDGVDVLLHCASVVSGPPELCEDVNVRGTQALLEEAQRAGVSRVVHLSTASVYGRGVYRNARVADLEPAPRSAVSRTREQAERLVLEAGGTVVRPYLVYGEGDVWSIAGLLDLLRTLGSPTEGWHSRLSVIDVDDLARAMVHLALMPRERLGGAVYHAAHPEPVFCSDLIETLATIVDLPTTGPALTYAAARERLRAAGLSTHFVDMVATDHWFDSGPLWSDIHCDPGPGFKSNIHHHAHWYRQRYQSPQEVA